MNLRNIVKMFSVLAFTTTAATSVVACGNKGENPKQSVKPTAKTLIEQTKNDVNNFISGKGTKETVFKDLRDEEKATRAIINDNNSSENDKVKAVVAETNNFMDSLRKIYVS